MGSIKKIPLHDGLLFEIEPDFIYMPSFDIKPIEGYIAPEHFPNCCDFHRGIVQDALNFLEIFPNCCDNHKALAKKGYIDKEKYKNLPNKIVSQIHYTEHFISERINSTNWSEDIQNYIEYNIKGFGQPVIGADAYLNNIIYLIKNKPELKIPEIKKKQLIEVLNNQYFTKKKNNKININKLIETYNKWFKLFPFEISYLNSIKEKYKKRLPILAENPRYNPYTGLSIAKIHTQTTLIYSLLEITKSLLSQINGVKLYEEGQLSDTNKIQIELLNKERKIEIEELENKHLKEELPYLKIIKNWLKGEQGYFMKLKNLLKENTDDVLEQYFKYDFKFFLDEILKSNRYNKKQITSLNESYNITKEELKQKIIENEEQHKLLITAQIRKYHYGRTLPSHFQLTNDRNCKILDFKEYGKMWAYFDTWQNLVNPKQKTKKEILTDTLKQLNFFDLESVASLPIKSQNQLVELISDNSIPYLFAMFDHLGFIEYIEKNFVNTKAALYKFFKKHFSISERTTKGQINVLNNISKEDRKRYTSHNYKEIVKKDYQNLK